MKLHLPSPLLAALLAVTAPAYADNYPLTTGTLTLSADQTIGNEQSVNGDVTLNGQDYQDGHRDGHSVTLTSGADITITGALNLVSSAKLVIQSDTALSVTGALSLGHNEDRHPGKLDMSGGDLSIANIALNGNNTNTLSISSGSVTFSGTSAITQTGNHRNNSTVLIGGTGESSVTLTATNESGLTFDYANLTLGNITIAAESKAVTFTGATLNGSINNLSDNAVTFEQVTTLGDITIAADSKDVTFTGATLSGHITHSGTATITLAGATTISDSLIDKAFYTDTAGNSAANENQNGYAKCSYTLDSALTLADRASLNYNGLTLTYNETDRTYSTIDTSVYYIRTDTPYTQSLTNAGTLRITEGKTIDMNGVATESKSIILEAGSTLANTGGAVGSDLQQNNNVTLLGDATMDAQSSFCMIGSGYANTKLDLGGYTLNKTGSGTLNLYNTAITAGTIDVQVGSISMVSYDGRVGSLADGVKFNLATGTQVSFGDGIGGEQVGKAILASTGTGTFNISSNATLTGATGGSTTNSSFAGLLNVTGGTLTLGHGQQGSNDGWQISAADMNIKLAGGNLYYFGHDSSFGNLTVNKNASYTVYATDRHTVNHKELSIAAGATLTLSANWGNTNLHADSLTGDGNLNLGANLTATIDQVTNYQGSITIGQSRGSLTLGANASSTVDLNNPLTNAGTLTLKGNATLSGVLNNSGTMTLDGNTTLSGVLNNSGTMTLNADTALNHTVTNSGTITQAAGHRLTLAGTMDNSSGNVTLNGAIAISSTGAYEAVQELEYTYSVEGSNGFRTATGTYYLVKGGTTTLGEGATLTINGVENSTLSKVEGGITFESTVRSAEFFVTRGSFDEDTLINAGTTTTTTQYVLQGGTLSTDNRIDSTRLRFSSGSLVLNTGGVLVISDTQDDNASLVQHSSGAGNIELNSTLTILSGALSGISGELKVNSGGTLQLGSTDFIGGTTGTDSLSFSSGTLTLNGGRVRYRGGNSSINSMKVTAASTLDLWDMKGDNDGVPTTTFTIHSLNLKNALSVTSSWKYGLNIGELTGSGNLTLNSGGNKQIINVAVANGYTGLLDLAGAVANMTVSLAVNASASARLKGNENNTINSLTLAAGAALKYKATADNITLTVKQLKVDGTVTLGTNVESGDSGYQAQFNIASLSNSANGSTADDVLTLESQSNTTQRTVFNVQGGEYEGTIKLLLNQGGNSRKVALNLSNKAAAKAVIELAKGSNADAAGTLALGLATDEVSVRGITGSVGGIYSGAQAFGRENSFAGNDTTRTLKINTAGSNYSTAAALGDHINLHKEGTGSQTFSGTVAGSIGKVQVDAGELKFTNRANLSIEQLTLLGEATLSISQNNAASTIAITDAVTLTGGARLNAGLDLSAANTLTLNADTTVTINGSLVLSGTRTVTLAGNILTQLSALEQGGTLNLFTGISSLTLGEQNYTLGGADLTAEGNALLGNYFTGVEGGSYALGYTASTGTLYAQCLSVPEPTTATLSLLALSALAARRRRRR